MMMDDDLDPEAELDENGLPLEDEDDLEDDELDAEEDEEDEDAI